MGGLRVRKDTQLATFELGRATPPPPPMAHPTPPHSTPPHPTPTAGQGPLLHPPRPLVRPHLARRAIRGRPLVGGLVFLRGLLGRRTNLGVGLGRGRALCSQPLQPPRFTPPPKTLPPRPKRPPSHPPSHRDGTLKREVAANPSKYIHDVGGWGGRGGVFWRRAFGHGGALGGGSLAAGWVVSSHSSGLGGEGPLCW
jgi:hypothetical protein